MSERRALKTASEIAPPLKESTIWPLEMTHSLPHCINDSETMRI